MNTLKKIIFLSNNEKNNSMGILTLEKRNNNTFGVLKTYQSDLSGEYTLGLKVNDKIIKQNVNLSNNIYNFIISDNIDLCSNIGCVLLKINKDNITPIIWGNEKNKDYKTKIIQSLKDSISKLNKSSSHQSEPKKLNTEINDSISNLSTLNIYPQHDNYKELKNLNEDENFNTQYNNKTQEEYSQISLEPEDYMSEIAIASSTANLYETTDEELEKIIDNNLDTIESGKHEFYDMIADQLKELFDRYPKEENLSKLINNSEWVKIANDFDNNSYVVGIIFNNNDVKYICYGVPGLYSNEPPREMRNYSQWFPTDIKDPYNNGYWVMYQDANTGENIFIN